MRRILPIALAVAMAYAPTALSATGPLRILYVGDPVTDSSNHCHALMQKWGRDAIWFDYVTDLNQAPSGWKSTMDAVVLENSHLQLDADAPPTVVPPSGTPVEEWGELFRTKLLAAAGEKRVANWQAVLAQREAEQREPNPNVANYEKRATAVTYQHPFSVKGSVERTQVPVDCHLELFAGEPEIAKPIAMAWDERGRLWVCETRDYPHGVRSSGEGNDSIKICEDTDGDGRADKFTIFADHLNLPTSLVFARGGVIVAQSPRFLFLKDTDGDDKADVREVVIEGWGIGDTHAQANNLHRGFDNWLYGCVGYSGFEGDVGGVHRQFGMGTYRFKSDGSALEFLHQFSNNSWGQSVNAAGDDFGGTANGAPIFYGGIPATAYPAGMKGMTAKKINLEDKAHPITSNYRQVDVFGGYTAAAGSAFIYSSNLPPRFQGKAMVCEPTMKLISLMDVVPRGAGYVARDSFNLLASSDEWMSPVFSEVGPDGAVWIADWQNFIIQHNPTPSVARGGYEAKTGPGGAHENPLRDHERGRIYRLVWNHATHTTVRLLRGADGPTLVKALNSDNLFWRQTAQRLLVEGKVTSAVDALRTSVADPQSGPAAVHALWSLQGLGQLDGATHRLALLSRSPDLRRNAVRALGSDTNALGLYFSSGVVTDPDLVTRLAALVKLAQFPTTKEIQTLVATLSRNPVHRSDEWLNEATRILSKVHDVPLFQEGPNLLPNGGLEQLAADGLPEGWKRRDYGDRAANASAHWESVSGPGQSHSGSRAVRCVSQGGEADTSLHAEVTLKPNTEYRLSGWVKGIQLRGKISFNDHLNRPETSRVTKDGDWTEVEVTYRSGNATQASINILFVARGEGYFDDVRFSELLPIVDANDTVVAADPKRGEDIFYHHTARCVLCHMVKGQGSTVGPALDGIATRKDASYIRESLLEPNKVLAAGYEALGNSPMPPMGEIFNNQELADIQAFLQTLK